MKHNVKITLILLAMFVVTQFIGIYVVHHYANPDNKLPYGMQNPEIQNESDFYTSFLPSIVIAFVFAILLLILLTKFKLSVVLKVWFFIVILIALGIFLTSVLPNWKYASWIALAIALPFALIKVFQRNFIVHNLTELVIYPAIAAVFVPLLNLWTIIFLLVLISVYDMWAVWRSGIMQKMAKYQINELKIFSGFFVPYISKKQKAQLIKIKKENPKKLNTTKIKANIAILGGGDVVFPIIASGVAFAKFGFFGALFVIIGATLGLGYLMLVGEKKKFYPAMPFITVGIFLGIIAAWLIL
jgi:presenilin-like A22 family membrane protease